MYIIPNFVLFVLLSMIMLAACANCVNTRPPLRPPGRMLYAPTLGFHLGIYLRPLYYYSLQFSQLAQIFRIVKILDSDIPLAKAPRRQVRNHCHFDQREKSLLDPSHSLGMTGIGPSPLRLCGKISESESLNKDYNHEQSNRHRR